MSDSPGPEKPRVEVTPVCDLAEAGYLRAQLAEAGIRSWFRGQGGDEMRECCLVVDPEDAGRARELLEELGAAEPSSRLERGNMLRKTRRSSIAFLAFLLCARLGRVVGGPVAFGAGIVAAVLCFRYVGDGTPAPPAPPE